MDGNIRLFRTLYIFIKLRIIRNLSDLRGGKKADLSLELLLLTEFPAEWKHESQTFHRVIDNTIKRETGGRGGGGGRAPLIAFTSPQKKRFPLARNNETGQGC